MNFIVVGYHNWYGSMGQWVADLLKQTGHEVEAVDRNAVIPVKKAVYFFVDCSEDFSDNMPDIPYPKVFWSLDAHMPGGLSRACNIASKCDLVISTNKEHGCELLSMAGIDSYLCPITYREDYFHKAKKDIDVVMIGHPNSPQREQLWEIVKRYNSFAGRIDDLPTYSDIMSRAKIIINQPTEPWDNILNNRFFETMGANALLLQKRLKTTLIEDLGFSQGNDFLYWNNLDEIPVVLDTVLKNYDSYKGIIASGNQKVKQYEMKQQLEKIIALIKTKFDDTL